MTTLGNILSHIRFLKKKPLVIPRAMSGIIKTNLFGQKVLRTVDWAVTYRCNARCIQCSARKLYKPGMHEMTLEERKDVWEQAVKLGAIHTQFTGGEPLCMGVDWLEKAIQDLHPEKTLVCMSSNGSLLTEEILKRLSDAGLDTLQLSIDSMITEVHDRLRGLPGNFNHIMKMAKYAQSIGINVGLGSVLAKNNLDEMKKIDKYTKQHGYHHAVNRLSNDENFTEDYYKSWEKNINSEDYKIYKNYMCSENHIRTDTFLNYNLRSGCPAYCERIEITPAGEIMSCPQCQISFGNVLEETLKVIWKRLYTSPLFNNFCSECRWCWDQKFYDMYLLPYKNEPKPIKYDRIIEDLKKKGIEPYSPKW